MNVLQEWMEGRAFSHLWVRNRKRDSAGYCDDLDVVVLRLDLPAPDKSGLSDLILVFIEVNVKCLIYRAKDG